MNSTIKHVIEVRTTGKDGRVVRRDPHDPSETQSPVEPSKNPTVENSVSRTVLIKMGQRAGMYAASNYGELTGDYAGQQRITETLQLVTLGVMAISSPLGAALAGFQVAAMGVDRVTSVRRSRIESKALQERAGIIERGGR